MSRGSSILPGIIINRHRHYLSKIKTASLPELFSFFLSFFFELRVVSVRGEGGLLEGILSREEAGCKRAFFCNEVACFFFFTGQKIFEKKFGSAFYFFYFVLFCFHFETVVCE